MDWKPPRPVKPNLRYDELPEFHGTVDYVCGACDGPLIATCDCDRMYCRSCKRYCRNGKCPQHNIIF